MTTRPRSKRRTPNRKSQGPCRTNRREWGRGSRRVLRDRGHRGVLYIFFQSLVSRVCSVPSLPRSPLQAWLYLRASRFRRGLATGRLPPEGDRRRPGAPGRCEAGGLAGAGAFGRVRVAPIAARQEAHRDEFGERRRGPRSVHPVPGSEVSQDQFGGQLLARWRPLRVGLAHQPSPTLPTATASAQPSPHSSARARESRSPKRLSMYSFAKELGATIVSSPSTRLSARQPSNQTLSEEVSISPSSAPRVRPHSSSAAALEAWSGSQTGLGASGFSAATATVDTAPAAPATAGARSP